MGAGHRRQDAPSPQPNEKGNMMSDENQGTAAQCRSVLLVDDEQMVLEVGKAILQRLGHDVITAYSGEEAIETYKRYCQSIGCVVLDLTMPGIDGKETFETLRTLSPDLPVIIASGLPVDQVLTQFAGNPPSSIIQKPYQVADLSNKIESIMTHPA